MKKLHLDLLSRDPGQGYWIGRLWAWSCTGWLLLALAGLGVLMLLAGAMQDRNRLHWLQERTQDAQARLVVRDPQTRSSQSTRLTPTQAAAVNAAVRGLNFPWQEVMQVLEEAQNPLVAVLELSPQRDGASLKGVAEARNSDDMLAYVQRLKAQPFFTSALLSGHQVNDQDKNKPLRFEFVLTWRAEP